MGRSPSKTSYPDCWGRFIRLYLPHSCSANVNSAPRSCFFGTTAQGATKDKGNKMDLASPFKLLFNFVKTRKKARMISYLNKINPEIKGSSAISPNLPIEKATRISDLLDK